MKRNKLVPIMAGLIILTGAGVSNIVMAQFSRSKLMVNNDNISHNEEDTGPESDPKVEEHNLQNEFRGINLTPQQFDQIKQARRQFRDGFKQAALSNFGSLFQMTLLPKKEAEDMGTNIFRNPIVNYSEAISKILTPEELKIWHRNLEEGAKRNQQGS